MNVKKLPSIDLKEKTKQARHHLTLITDVIKSNDDLIKVLTLSCKEMTNIEKVARTNREIAKLELENHIHLTDLESKKLFLDRLETHDSK